MQTIHVVTLLNTQEHLEKANRNKSITINHLLDIVDNFPDWVSIAAFYSALHFVEALFATHGMHFDHHEERHTHVSDLMPDISSMYLRLYDLGFSSRYLSVRQIPNPSDARDLVNIELTELENYVREHLR